MGFEERRIGTVIGKWRVDSLLGSGSMAAVFAVTHRNGSRAALKILHGQLCNDDAVVERFLSEGYLANVVKHPGIVRVFDDGMTDEGCPFLAMEVLEGETLEDYREVKGPKLDLETTVAIADSIMDVLAAVHAGGVIHRDLKPSNVFLTTDREIKLLDFGVAKLSDKKSVSKLSLVGMVLGTPAYMAPEQALGARELVDARSDIFALGAMVFTMLTGEYVHPVEGTQQKLLAAATAKARSLGSVMPHLTPGIIAVVDQALQFKKDDRWQTVTQMRNALKEATELARKGSLRPPQPSTARLTSTERGSDGTLVNAHAPTFDESGQSIQDAPSSVVVAAVPSVPSPPPAAPVLKTLLGMPARPMMETRNGPADVVASRGHDLETTQIVAANPYGLVAPSPAGRNPPPTASGQYLAVPDVSDSGRAGFFYDREHPPSSQANLNATSPPIRGHEHQAMGNGSYPSGAETDLDDKPLIPLRPKWPFVLGLAAVVALAAGGGVYLQKTRSTTKDSGATPPDTSALPSFPSASSSFGLSPLPSSEPPSKASAGAPPTAVKPTAWTPAPKPFTSVSPPSATEKPGPSAPKPDPKPTPPDIEIIE